MKRDDPRQIAFSGMAPMAERNQAMGELHKSHALAQRLIPAEDIQPVIDHIRADMAEQAMLKAAQPVSIVLDPRKLNRDRGMRSVYLDDLQLFATGDYYETPSPLGFDSMRQMVDQTPVLNAVIMTRIRQISRFCRPQETDDTPGFSIRHTDSMHQITSSEQDSVRMLQRFVANCGWEFNPRRRQQLHRDAFTEFVSKVVRDSLTMDSAPIETELKKSSKLGMDGFYAVDGATIRLCNEHGYDGDDEIFALQVVQGRVRTAYTYDDLIYVPRNPRTDVRLAGYGLGETELLVRVVTGFLNAMTMNIKGFTDNAIPKGVLHLSGDYNTEDLNAFKRYWNAQVKGINNAWTVPVMVSKDQDSRAQFEKFGIEYDEMYFSKWMTFLTSIICAIYAMSPDEINFESFSAQRASLSGDDTTEKLASSIDKGLRPLMAHMESLVSDYILSTFADKFVFRFSGLDPKDPERSWDFQQKSLSLNEIRAQGGYDKWEDKDKLGLGDAPLNPTLFQAWQAAKQAEQQKDGMDFGQPDAAPEEPDNESPAKRAGGSAPEDQERPEPTGLKEKPDFGGGDSAGDFGAKSLTIYTVED